VSTTQTESADSRTTATTGSFGRLWGAYSVSVLGDEFYAVAVPLIVFQIGGTAGAMTVVYACSLLPQAVSGLLGGVLADRYDRVRSLRACYAASGLILFAACALFALRGVSVSGLAAVAILLGVFAAVAAACFDSVLPNFVPAGRLSRANAMTEASRTACVVAGPAAAGLVTAATAPQYSLLVDGVSFALSFALLNRMGESRRDHAGRPRAARRSAWLEFRSGLRHAFVDNSAIRVGVTLSTVVNLVFGAYEPLLVYRLRAQLGVSAEGVGVILAIAGATAVAVAVLLSWRAPTRGLMAIMTLSATVQGLAVLAIGLFSSVAIITAGEVAFVSAMVLYTVSWRALRQSRVPAHLLGRVAGACRSVAYAGAFGGSVVSAILLDGSIRVNTSLAISGAAVAILGATMFTRSRRRERAGEGAT
jgi:MFS family permease